MNPWWAFAGGLVTGLTAAWIAVYSYVSSACQDVSSWAGIINALGGNVPHHLIVCGLPG